MEIRGNAIAHYDGKETRNFLETQFGGKKIWRGKK
jgi:hypothetical protein